MLSILHIEFHFKGYVAFSLSLQHTIDSFIRIVFNIVYVMVPSFDENITQIVYIYPYVISVCINNTKPNIIIPV